MKVTELDKTIIDVSSFAGLGLVFAGILPVIASGLTVIWMGIRIYETETVKRLMGRNKDG